MTWKRVKTPATTQDRDCVGRNRGEDKETIGWRSNQRSLSGSTRVTRVGRHSSYWYMSPGTHGMTAPQRYLEKTERGASAGVQLQLQITKAWMAQRNDTQYGQKEIYLEDDATGQGSGGKRMQWALTSIVGLRCNRRYGNSNSSFSLRARSAQRCTVCVPWASGRRPGFKR